MSMTKQSPATQSTALGHLRVLEVVDEVGEQCGKMLADMGADVIRIEPLEGSSTRHIGPFLKNEPNPNRSLHFWHYNTNKRSITLNLDTSRGQDIFARLAEDADMMIESMPPGYMDDRGLSFHELREINPRLIHVSISAFGRGGPRGHLKGGDLVGWATSGYMYTTGWSWQKPTRPWGRQASHAGCLYAVSGALAALFNRWRTGEGQHVDISLQEAVASTVEQATPFYAGDGEISGRRSNDHVNGKGGTKVLPCKDGWVHLNIGWRNEKNPIVDWMAEDNMAGDLVDEKWFDEKYRQANIEHVVKLIKKWAKTKTKSEFFNEGQTRHQECGPINTIPEALEDPQLKSRGYWVAMNHPELNETFTYPGAPYQFGETPWSARRRAPLIGEDNASIYEKELGLSEGEIAKLVDQGII